MRTNLLTRDQFREGVFERDNHLCIMCGNPGKDAHHILERRLFPDGGYYLDNGATVCEPCHIAAEQTLITCEDLREKAKIKRVVLPPHLYSSERYDKWGNPYLPNGLRLRGELFDDLSVQKVLAVVLSQFTNRVKYPRTWHLPTSPGVGKDDRVLRDLSILRGLEIVITEKMDGENTTMYRDYIHARSSDYNPHPSRGWVRGFHAQIKNDIPEGWRICGENLFAKHSIAYQSLPSFFMGFSVWTDANECMSWDDTVEWLGLFGIQPVPVLYRGQWSDSRIAQITQSLNLETQEGYVIRAAKAFKHRDFTTHVAKYVRGNHITTTHNWMMQAVERNGMITA